MSVPKWGLNDRWPNKPIEIRHCLEPGNAFAFGHIPFGTFLAALKEQDELDDADVDDVRPTEAVRHELWHIKHDLFGEYGWTYERRVFPGPFVAPVTVWGES